MKITRVQIKNWRSIRLVDFYPEDICILVGANNAGKTNILSAVNFLLGDRFPMPANLEDSDFFERDRDNHIHIRLTLDHPEVSRIDFDTEEHYALSARDRQDRPIRPFSNAHRAEVAFAYVDASRNYERQFGTSRWSLFGQALRQLHQKLKDSGDQVDLLREALGKAHDLLRTEEYQLFERELRDAFAAQLKTARYDVQFEFRTMEETNLYRSLYPTLVERGVPRHPQEVGSGVRNVLVLALFQAFAKSFRGDAVLGIEEPELYLHPHAQRSLMRQFEDLAKAGNQIFISTHSAHFLDIARSDRIVLVERCEDEEEEVCTQVRTTSSKDLLSERQRLHRGKPMTVESMRAYIKNVASAEMTEAYFARVVVIVEGPSEREALPIYALACGLEFDAHGISVVQANGKSGIDMLVQLYAAHGIRTYVVFDNDSADPASARSKNHVLCRLLGLPEVDVPAACVTDAYAILEQDWEAESRAGVDAMRPGAYAEYHAEGRSLLGLSSARPSKPLEARYIANAVVEREGRPPQFAKDIVDAIRKLLPDDPPQPGNDGKPDDTPPAAPGHDLFS